MKPLVIYHANCADGFGAAFAAWAKLGDEADYLPMQYGAKFDNGLSHASVTNLNSLSVAQREVYILDFSLPKESMSWLFATAKYVVWLDHHKTAFEMWHGEIPKDGIVEDQQSDRTIVLDNNRSGAMLAWEYFHPDISVPQLVKHIDDYDRWQFKLDGTKEFNKALWSYAPWTFELWQRFLNDALDVSFLDQGAAILRAHDQNVQSVVKGAARRCVINGAQKLKNLGNGPDLATYASGLAANCPPHLTSDVGHELANQSGTFGLCWTLAKEGMTANCSLRSNGNYDVSPIAKAFGGGGHKNAAGFEVPVETLLGWLK